MTEAIEDGNRRAEIEDDFVVFFRLTGNIRRSKQPIWFVECRDHALATRLARRWVFRAKKP